MSLRPWVRGPFELIVHAELHLRTGEDFDRRVALISFDNAIEVAIANYLSLNPMHRKGREYPREEVSKWERNFHSQLDFLRSECGKRGIAMQHEKEDLAWYHELRNEQYHKGSYAAPNKDVLVELRNAALWVFSMLYDIENIEAELDEQLALFQITTSLSKSKKEEIQQDEEFDRIIDETYPEVEIAGGIYKASEILFKNDPENYREIALELLQNVSPSLRIAS